MARGHNSVVITLPFRAPLQGRPTASVPRTAVVHDWLVTWRGGENVLEQVLKVVPDADLYALVDFLPDALRARISGRRARTSWLQGVPFARDHFRKFLPLFPAAIRAIDLGAYDRVISISHAVAKNVRTRPGQEHLCYCLTPMRYAWDMRDAYLASLRPRSPIRWSVGTVLGRLRRWDAQASAGVTRFSGISRYVVDRIARAYGRSATLIYPPVEVDVFRPASPASTRECFVTAGQWVPYKKVDAIVAAFRALPHLRLVVVGEGPEASKVRAAAGDNVTFVGSVEQARLVEILQSARAFVFAAEEDFGILPVEAQACGTPVIALSRGGTCETIIAEGDHPTGILFDHQTPDDIAAAIRRFEAREHHIDRDACRAQSLKFSASRFRAEFGRWLEPAPADASAGRA